MPPDDGRALETRLNQFANLHRIFIGWLREQTGATLHSEGDNAFAKETTTIWHGHGMRTEANYSAVNEEN